MQISDQKGKEVFKMFRKSRFTGLSVLCMIFVLTFVIFISTGSAQEKSVLDEVLDSGKLTVAVFSDVPPLGFYSEKNEPTGIDVDVAILMAETLGVKVEFVSTTNANRIPYLLTNKVDCVIASFTMNPERRKVVEFSDAYFRGGAILVTNPKNPNSAQVKGIQDLEGKNVAVSKGSFNDELATKLVGKTAKSIIRFDNVSDLYEALKDGKADAIVEDVVLAGYVTKNHYSYMKVTGDLLSIDTWGIGVRRGDQIWINWINGFIFELLSSGGMKQICEKYGVTYSSVNYEY